MRDDHSSEMIRILGDILLEIQEMRSQFNEFTGYNTMKMADAVDGLGDRITGGIRGIGGDSLEDVVQTLKSVEDGVAIELQEIKTQFNEFTGYGTTKMSDIVDELGDKITGSMAGFGGSNIEDIVRNLEEVVVGLQAVETSIDVIAAK